MSHITYITLVSTKNSSGEIRTIYDYSFIAYSHILASRLPSAYIRAYTYTHVGTCIGVHVHTYTHQCGFRPYKVLIGTNELYIILTYERHYRPYESFAKRERREGRGACRGVAKVYTEDTYIP